MKVTASIRSLKKFVGVLWDIDGSLIDSEQLHDQAVIVALRDMGLGDICRNFDILGTTWDQTWRIPLARVKQKIDLRNQFRADLEQSGLDPDEVQQLLAEIYGWFTEGFDTKDLQEAKALLEEFH